jgi:hypothetical protein
MIPPCKYNKNDQYLTFQGEYQSQIDDYTKMSAAAHPKVNQMFASIVQEVSVHTLESFKDFLAERVEFDAEMQKHFDEYKKQLEASTKAHVKNAGKAAKAAKSQTQKKPRELSNYNKFIQAKISELKSQGHTGNLMKLAVEAYNKKKQEQAEA